MIDLIALGIDVFCITCGAALILTAQDWLTGLKLLIAAGMLPMGVKEPWGLNIAVE